MADDTPEVSISRRRILKRIGAGTVIAWSAPMISSLTVPAYAQNYGGDPCVACGCLGEPGAPPCGTSPQGEQCICSARSPDSGGGCVCVAPLDVSEFCGPGDTCPDGYACLALCDTFATRCHPLCGTVV